jgi:hypothetical protein
LVPDAIVIAVTGRAAPRCIGVNAECRPPSWRDGPQPDPSVVPCAAESESVLPALVQALRQPCVCSEAWTVGQ